MAKRETISDTSLSEVDSLRTYVQEKFQSLHIALDERETDLMFRLDEIRGTIVTALKQWNGKVKDAKQVIAHAKAETRKSKLNSKVEDEAKEDLEYLKKNKPTFEISFALRDGVEEMITNFGIINMKQTNIQTNTRAEIESLHISDRSVFGIMRRECPILQDQVEEKSRVSRRLIGDGINRGVKYQTATKKDLQTKEYKLTRSISCTQLSEIQQNEGKISFDASPISMKVKPKAKATEIPKPIELTESIDFTESVEPMEFVEIPKGIESPELLEVGNRKGFIWHRGARKNPNRNANKPQFNRACSLYAEESSSSAMYKLTEVKINIYLAERVTVNLRKKQVNGTLRCVVNEGVKIPTVGIELDTNDGDCDGCFGKTRYFKTKTNKACFVSADRVRITISM